jgi:hypothetical protein
MRRSDKVHDSPHSECGSGDHYCLRVDVLHSIHVGVVSGGVALWANAEYSWLPYVRGSADLECMLYNYISSVSSPLLGGKPSSPRVRVPKPGE